MEIYRVIVLLCECMWREEWKSRLFLRPWPRIRNLPGELDLLSLMSKLTGQRVKSFCLLPGDTEDFEVKRNRTSCSRGRWETVRSVRTLCTYRRERLSEKMWSVAEDSVRLGYQEVLFGECCQKFRRPCCLHLQESSSPRKILKFLSPDDVGITNLHIFVNHSHNDTASQTGRTETSVSIHRHR